MKSHSRQSFFNISDLLGGTIRLLLLVVVLGGVILGSLAWWTTSQEAKLRVEVAELENQLQREIAAREAAIERLSRSHRKARIEILQADPGDPKKGTSPSTTLRFIELDDHGRELARRDFSVPGEVVYVDAWTARFPTESIASADPLRGNTIVLFRRIYSDLLAPSQGLPIDTPGAVPEGYAGSERARYEQAIWSNFWQIASDPEKAQKYGVRVAQGEAVYKPMQAGEVYELNVESHGGLTLVPLDSVASAEAP